jgi:RecG-like helicase
MTSHPITASFADAYPFGLDDFQLQGCHELEDGNGVLVAAPTGAGKTVVGEFAVHLARQQGRKCFYTTPIKALSNQKYHDLVARHGAENIGLLTGDHVSLVSTASAFQAGPTGYFVVLLGPAGLFGRWPPPPRWSGVPGAAMHRIALHHTPVDAHQ